MDRTTQEALIGRIMTDKTFRDGLFEDPETTLKANGYPVHEHILDALKNADPKAVESMSAHFENRTLSGSST